MNGLILGGVRSGKSRHAERLALNSRRPVTLIATALGLDAEMRARIDSHRATRPAGWRVVEEPYALATALSAVDDADGFVIVDCLTLWITQLLDEPARLATETAALLALLPRLSGTTWFIGNETGLGIMPLGETTRRYVDASGALHQELARRCDRVDFMIAGLPLSVKGTP